LAARRQSLQAGRRRVLLTATHLRAGATGLLPPAPPRSPRRPPRGLRSAGSGRSRPVQEPKHGGEQAYLVLRVRDQRPHRQPDIQRAGRIVHRLESHGAVVAAHDEARVRTCSGSMCGIAIRKPPKSTPVGNFASRSRSAGRKLSPTSALARSSSATWAISDSRLLSCASITVSTGWSGMAACPSSSWFAEAERVVPQAVHLALVDAERGGQLRGIAADP